MSTKHYLLARIKLSTLLDKLPPPSSIGLTFSLESFPSSLGLGRETLFEAQSSPKTLQVLVLIVRWRTKTELPCLQNVRGHCIFLHWDPLYSRRDSIFVLSCAIGDLIRRELSKKLTKILVLVQLLNKNFHFQVKYKAKPWL